MKALHSCLLGCLVAAAEVSGADTTQTVSRLPDLAPSERALAQSLTNPAVAPNVIVGEKVVYSGVLVQCRKTKKWWQLFNPFASEKYGRGDQNLDIDPITGRPRGITLFSISPKPRPASSTSSP